MKTIIIDPVSPEFNRGSFCYLPYILYSALSPKVFDDLTEDDDEVLLYENFCAADVDSLPKADRYWIALWSHPQIEHVKTMLQFLPAAAEKKVFGYTPLIQAHQLPLLVPSDKEILLGLSNYVYHFDEFKQVLLSDCDMHLQGHEGTMYPFFTSYGCPAGCAFCPSSANQPRRLVLNVETVKGMLNYMQCKGRCNLHFTDEDLFFDAARAKEIIDHIIILNQGGSAFKLIALASRHTFDRFIQTYGTDCLEEAGFLLLEVGLETASESLSESMGKTGLGACVRLAEASSVPILWLTMTFYPGETLRTLRETGIFLEKYGLPADKLCRRIAGNGTHGGLGQFFQPYEGTEGFAEIDKQGIILTPRPLRLLPSFVPYSFLHCRVQQYRQPRLEEIYWYDLYRVKPLEAPTKFVLGREISSIARTNFNTEIEGYISLAISAKLGVIQ